MVGEEEDDRRLEQREHVPVDVGGAELELVEIEEEPEHEVARRQMLARKKKHFENIIKKRG